MKTKLYIAALALFFASTACQAKAAVVSFLGEVQAPGIVGPVLGSLPRNFKLSLTYVENPIASPAAFTGTFFFPATPNGNTTNPNVEPMVTVNTTGSINVLNDNGGFDQIRFLGNVPSGAGGLGTQDVNYSFIFSNPDDTVDNNFVTVDNVQALITGQTTITFTGGLSLSASGVIQEAPEPSTMVALTALVAVGSGIGLRRRRAAKKAREENESADC